MFRFFILTILFNCSLFAFSQKLTLNQKEKDLYLLIMEYRKEHNLPKIPLSRSLTYVAKLHVRDLQINKPDTGECNMHSWSHRGKWAGCCYSSSKPKGKCMWDKPRELTPYKGDGFEIAYWSRPAPTAQQALDGWKTSKGHNSVIINQGSWTNSNWQAIGVGVYGGYAVVWFGKEAIK